MPGVWLLVALCVDDDDKDKIARLKNLYSCVHNSTIVQGELEQLLVADGQLQLGDDERKGRKRDKLRVAVRGKRKRKALYTRA